MAHVREHRRAAGLTAVLLILVVLLPGCGSARAWLAMTGHPSAGPRTETLPSSGAVRSRVALESLRMLTPLIGWALAVDKNGYPLAVVKTTDGGREWRAAGPPGLRGQALRAAFYGTRDAWVTWSSPWSRAWSVTYRTTDGGRIWARMGSIPIAAIGASAPDMMTGRLGWVTAGLGVAAGSSGIAIFRTVDGGARWRIVDLTSGQGRQAPGAIPFGCDKGAAMFSSTTTGWVTGSCAGGRPAFWVSHDGGRTWRHQPLQQPSGSGMLANCQCFLTAPVFTSPEDGALWASDMPRPPGMPLAAYLTHDGGETWEPIRLPGGRVPLQTPDMVDGQRGFVIGGRRTQGVQPPRDVRLYATTDGGTNWTSRSASPLLGQATLDFVTPAVGFASVISYNPLRSYLLQTSNGGATWTGVPARLVGRARSAGASPGAPKACDGA